MSTREAAKGFAWYHVTAMVILLSGLGLVALSLFWPRVFAGKSGWTQEQASKYQAASADVHRLSMQAGSTPPEDQTRSLQNELAKAQAEYGALRDELDAARARPGRIAAILRYLGIALAVGGALALAAKSNR